MSNVEDEAVDSTFNFTKRIISEKSDTELEYESFFRTTAELDKELAGKTRLATMIHLANLRRTKSACVLKNDFLCLLDGDWNGNLKEIQKQNLVFLKMLKCKNGEGNKQHLPLCLRDDRLPKFGCFFLKKVRRGGGSFSEKMQCNFQQARNLGRCAI